MNSRGALRWRYPLLAAWGLLLSLPTFHRAHDIASADWHLLAAGSRIIAGLNHLIGPLHVYAVHPDIQVGPPALALSGALQAIFGRTGGDYAVLVVIVALGVAAVWALDGLSRHWGASEQLTLVTGLTVMTMWASMGGWGHIEDTLAVTAVLVAARQVPAGRWWQVGVLLGFAVACKPWAIVATPLLLGLESRRLQTVAVAVVVAVVPWVPFVLADHHTLDLARYQWPVDPASGLHALGFSGLAPHWLRPVQLGVGLIVAALMARRAWWAAPLAGFAVKLALDPGTFAYYGLPVVAAAALVDLRRRSRLPVWAFAAVLVEYVLPAVLPDRVSGVARLAVGCVMAAALIWATRRTTSHPNALSMRSLEVTAHAASLSTTPSP